jgi:starch phosphorylase
MAEEAGEENFFLFGLTAEQVANSRGWYDPMHLADVRAYTDTQARVGQLYADPEALARKAILNIGSSGKFSSDRTITEYATEIWNVKPCPIV